MDPLIVYTDGSCLGNPGPGGWAALIRGGLDADRLLTGAEASTTNNRMELMAAIQALEALPPGTCAIVYTDSTYVKNGITQWLAGWKRKGWKGKSGPVKNIDLWQRLDTANAARSVAWRWVRGHAGNSGNEIVDTAAREAAERIAGGDVGEVGRALNRQHASGFETSNRYDDACRREGSP